MKCPLQTTLNEYSNSFAMDRADLFLVRIPVKQRETSKTGQLCWMQFHQPTEFRIQVQFHCNLAVNQHLYRHLHTDMICQFLEYSQGLPFHFSLEGLQLRRILNPVLHLKWSVQLACNHQMFKVVFHVVCSCNMTCQGPSTWRILLKLCCHLSKPGNCQAVQVLRSFRRDLDLQTLPGFGKHRIHHW